MEPEDPEKHIKEDTPDVIEDSTPGSENVGEPAEPAPYDIPPETPPFCGDVDYIEEEQEYDDRIRGWLAFFLWVVLPVGIIREGITFFEEWGFMKSFFDCHVWALFYFASYTLLTVYVITAFHKRWDDAVYAGYSLLAANLIITIGIGIGLISSSIKMPVAQHGMNSLYFQLFRNVAWCVIWFMFLNQSRRVEAVIPSETRRMRWPIYVLLILVLASLGGFLQTFSNILDHKEKRHEKSEYEYAQDYDYEPYSYLSDNTDYTSAEPEPYTPDYNAIIDEYIEGNDFPQVLYDDFTLTGISNLEQEVIQHFKVSYPKSDISLPFIKEFCAIIKQSLPMAADRLDRATARAGKNMSYKFVDVNGAHVYKYTIKSSELKKILEIE